MESEDLVHVLLVSFPAQGHVNPLLRLGKLLASEGLLVTFSTTESFGKLMRKANNITDQPTPVGSGLVRFEFFDDGLAEDDPSDLDSYMPRLERVGKEGCILSSILSAMDEYPLLTPIREQLRSVQRKLKRVASHSDIRYIFTQKEYASFKWT